MNLKYVLGVASLALSCAAQSLPVSSKELSQQAICRDLENYFQFSEEHDHHYCQLYVAKYENASDFMEEHCAATIPAELEEICHDFETLKSDFERGINEYCFPLLNPFRGKCL